MYRLAFAVGMPLGSFVHVCCLCCISVCFAGLTTHPTCKERCTLSSSTYSSNIPYSHSEQRPGGYLNSYSAGTPSIRVRTLAGCSEWVQCACGSWWGGTARVLHRRDHTEKHKKCPTGATCVECSLHAQTLCLCPLWSACRSTDCVTTIEHS